MMLSLRTHVIITTAILGVIVALAAIGNALHDSGMLPDSDRLRIASASVFLGLCMTLMFAAVPVIVKLVLGVQAGIGNAGHPAIAGIIRRERAIIVTLWGLIALGLAIAVPAAIINGAFD